MTIRPNPAGAARAAVLSAAAVVLGLLVLACVPLLLDQTSPLRLQERPHAAQSIPLVPAPSPEEHLFEQEAPPSPPLPPEPEIAIPPVDLPAFTPPDIRPSAPELPTLATEAPRPAPVSPSALPIELPAQAALSIRGLAVRPAAGQLAVNLRPDKLQLPVQAARTGYRFNLDEVDRHPESIATMQPPYPYQARQMAVEGYVTVRFLVSRTGSVNELTILKAVPEGIFEQTVKNTVRRWRFKPAQKNGRPVETWVRQSIEFKLQDAS